MKDAERDVLDLRDAFDPAAYRELLRSMPQIPQSEAEARQAERELGESRIELPERLSQLPEADPAAQPSRENEFLARYLRDDGRSPEEPETDRASPELDR